jgi:DNA-binding transcriptional MocR family regulator
MPAACARSPVARRCNRCRCNMASPPETAGLRQALSQKLVAYNVQATPGQIVTTVGATHALDIVSRTLLRAGDYVMVEEPGWAIEFARLAALGMRILPVPRVPTGRIWT